MYVLRGTYNDSTPLNIASRNGDADTVRRLIAVGADVNEKDGYGWAPLHEAAWRGDIYCMRLLIESGADINITEDRGETAMDILESRRPDLYAEYIEELMTARPEVQRLESEDSAGVPTGNAATGFDFDI